MRSTKRAVSRDNHPERKQPIGVTASLALGLASAGKGLQKNDARRELLAGGRLASNAERAALLAGHLSYLFYINLISQVANRQDRFMRIAIFARDLLQKFRARLQTKCPLKQNEPAGIFSKRAWKTGNY
jgi:hypothetical protein